MGAYGLGQISTLNPPVKYVVSSCNVGSHVSGLSGKGQFESFLLLTFAFGDSALRGWESHGVPSLLKSQVKKFPKIGGTLLGFL